MIAVCEWSANPVNNMMSIKNIYDQELNDAIEKMIGAIKPIMTILLGLMLSWIGSAMLGPIYSNIGNLGETTKSSSVD
jgi:type IV pilus assembly protein PilC